VEDATNVLLIGPSWTSWRGSGVLAIQAGTGRGADGLRRAAALLAYLLALALAWASYVVVEHWPMTYGRLGRHSLDRILPGSAQRAASRNVRAICDDTAVTL